jgi:hypothetical protein
MNVTLVRQKEVRGMEENGLYPVIQLPRGISVAVATCDMQGNRAEPHELLSLFPYNGVIYAPVKEPNLHVGILITSDHTLGLPMTVEGEPICGDRAGDGPFNPNGPGLMPYVRSYNSLFIAHRIANVGGFGRPIMTTLPDAGYAIGESENRYDSRRARQVRGEFRIWSRTQQEAPRDAKRGGSGFDRGQAMGNDYDRGNIAAVDKGYYSGQREEAICNVALGLGDGEELSTSIDDKLSFLEDAMALPRIQIVAENHVLPYIQPILNCDARDIRWSTPFALGWKNTPPILRRPPVATATPSLGSPKRPTAAAPDSTPRPQRGPVCRS